MRAVDSGPIANVKINVCDQENVSIEIRTCIENKTIIFIILMLGIISFILPIIVLILLFDIFDNVFGFLISLSLFWGSSIYFIRLFLWNYYGKEVYQKSYNKFHYYYDYKWFKDNVTTFSFKKISVGFKQQYDNKTYILPDTQLKNEETCQLAFIIDNKTLVTKGKVKFIDVLRIYNTLNENSK